MRFYTRSRRYKKYRLHNFLFDVIMLFLTCGFWAIWIFCREMRRRSC